MAIINVNAIAIYDLGHAVGVIIYAAVPNKAASV